MSENVRLTLPTNELEASFRRMLADYQAAGDHEHHRRLHYASSNELVDYFQSLRYQANGRGLRAGFVPNTMYWLMVEDEIVGETNIRHFLTPALLREGGHIGYRITPGWRRKGYGTRILTLALAEVARMGIPQTLVTCDTINIGSARIIQKNGGRFENELKSFHSGNMVSRYWFVTAPEPGEPFPCFEEDGPRETRERADVVALVTMSGRLLVLEDVLGKQRLPAGPILTHETATNAAWRLVYQLAGLTNLRHLPILSPANNAATNQRLVHLSLANSLYLARSHGIGSQRLKLRWYAPEETPALPEAHLHWWQSHAATACARELQES